MCPYAGLFSCRKDSGSGVCFPARTGQLQRIPSSGMGCCACNFSFVFCFLLQCFSASGYTNLTNRNILYKINYVRLRDFRALLSIECFPIVNAGYPRSVLVAPFRGEPHTDLPGLPRSKAAYSRAERLFRAVFCAPATKIEFEIFQQKRREPCHQFSQSGLPS